MLALRHTGPADHNTYLTDHCPDPVAGPVHLEGSQKMCGEHKGTPRAVKVSPLPAKDAKIVSNQLTALSYIISFRNQPTLLILESSEID